MRNLVYALCLLTIPLFGQVKKTTVTHENGFPVINIPEIPLQVEHSGKDILLISGSEDETFINLPGEPSIPWLEATIVLPQDASVESVTGNLLSIAYKTIMKGQLAATPPYATSVNDEIIYNWAGKTNIVDGKDADIYTKDAFWPSVDYKILEAGYLRSYKVVKIALPLAKYNPVTSEIKSLTAAKIAIEYKTGFFKGATMKNDVVGKKMLKGKVLNYDEIDTGTDFKLKSATLFSETYAIITTNEILSSSSELANFIAHKENMGFNVIAVTENDFGGGKGDVAAENIRAWLQANYLSQNIEYVLLIGNPNPNSTGVPMKMCWPRNYSSKDKNAPTDMYYAELTSNWDKDGDGFFGEANDDFGIGGIQGITDVYVGRIPYYGNVADLDAILFKTVTYEITPDKWRNSVLLSMKPLDPKTPGYHLGELIKYDIAEPNQWLSTRVYDQDYGLNPAAEYIPCNVTNVTNAWTQKPFGLVTWLTHGSSISAAGIMDVDHAIMLNDQYPSFVFQGSCNNAYPENNKNLSYSLLKNGGVVTIGATRVSWYYPGQIIYTGTSSVPGMGYEVSNNLIGGHKTAGEALEAMKSITNTENLWMNKLVFNIYGDPSLTIMNNVDELITLQAEDQTLHNAIVETEHSGYTGAGYVNYYNEIGSSVTFNVNLVGSGNYHGTLRYANGSNEEREMKMIVNGSENNNNLIFDVTGSWSTWDSIEFDLFSTQGDHTIEFVATGPSGGPNVDKLTLILDNSLPVANSDHFIIEKNKQSVLNVLKNDYDPEGNTISIVSTSQPANGTVVINGDGTISYTPPYTDFVGKESFSYTISDGNFTDLADVYIDVINQTPVVLNPQSDMFVSPISTRLLYFNNWFTDPDNDNLEYTISSSNESAVYATVFNEYSISLYIIGIGNSKITVTASDGQASVSDEFIVIATNNTTTPVVTDTIPDQTIQLGQSLSFDLNDVFKDPKGDVLSYSYSSSGNPISSNIIVGSIFSMAPYQEGTTIITLEATDPDNNSVSFSFTLNVVDKEQSNEISGITKVDPVIRDNESVSHVQNYPNPFSDVTNISFYLSQGKKVNISLIDMLGRQVTTIANDYFTSGYNEVSFECSSLKKGLYLYIITVDGHSIVKKMTIQ